MWVVHYYYYYYFIEPLFNCEGPIEVEDVDFKEDLYFIYFKGITIELQDKITHETELSYF